MTRIVLFLMALAVAVSAQAASFDPVEFFRGRTRGEGVLKVIFEPAKPVRVESVGTAEPDGTLVLVQRVDDHNGPPRTRIWRMRRLAPGRFTGTMDDAVGPVTIALVGDSARLTYVDHEGNHFDQLLTPKGPGEAIDEMKVRRFGFVVARLTETIRKLD
jgi:hypothetical protein